MPPGSHDEEFDEAGDTQLRPGTSFGSRYQIEKLLGAGGMGAVYKAYDSELGRTVALKLVKKELNTSRQIMQRFKQELLLASKISHKNILRIHDLGEVDGIKFITMAFVDGADLAGLIEKNGRLPLERALKFAKQLCSALDAAHTEGVVHRDLKPQNILIDHNDQLYVSDFGLAKSLEPDMTAMTQAGQVLGTPRYMSPEQVEAKEVDPRS
ncbi:MAG TPA: serine/threonine-protein kinase, partial [Bryobacteraceae bacterium]